MMRAHRTCIADSLIVQLDLIDMDLDIGRIEVEWRRWCGWRRRRRGEVATKIKNVDESNWIFVFKSNRLSHRLLSIVACMCSFTRL